MSESNLDGKVAIVTGAAGLLGREHCAALARAGARVVAADLEAAACERVAQAVAAEYGVRALGVAVDITSPESVDALHERVRRELGDVDVLVNNAAIDDKFAATDALEQSRFENYALERFRRSLDVNVTGTFLCCQKIGARMAERGRGSIVNVASTYGVVAPNQSLYVRPDGTQAFFKSAAYPTTKSAVLGLTRFLAAYFGPRGVRVNALSPGGVEAGQDAWFQDEYARRTPLGRMAKRTDYHGAIVYLASDASAYMTGANLVVDGGFTIW
ncbi:MAG TPA: SDR family oxidoreductase [Polyangiaceae bacterium]|nr:SDR family oxidoreductase [Polyangiaceae bacterium]